MIQGSHPTYSQISFPHVPRYNHVDPMTLGEQTESTEKCSEANLDPESYTLKIEWQPRRSAKSITKKITTPGCDAIQTP